MKDLDEFSQAMERQFGLISGYMVYALWELSTAAGSKWMFENPDTMEIIVTKENAEHIYGYCKEIRTYGYSVGLRKKDMAKIKEARTEAHKYLFEEANNLSTSIDRKIHLVKLTSKQ